MGSIRRVTHRSGVTSWQARWRDPAGRQHNKNFERKADAQRYLTTVEGHKLAGQYVDPSLGKIKFGEWARQMEAARVSGRRSTRARDESYLRSLVIPTLGEMPIGSVRPVTIQQWLAELNNRGYAPATVRKAYQILSRIFDAAVESGLLTRTPCRGVRLPRVEGSEMRFLSPGEITELADEIDPRYRALVLAAAYTGARFGELAALDLDHFEPLRRSIRIERTLSDVKGTVQIGEPKTRAAVRAITLPTWLVDVMAQHLAAWPVSQNRHLFTSPEGGYLRATNFRRRVWKPAVLESVGEPMRFHDLRHSHVALLIEQGVHPAVVASRLGHTSVRTVLDVYGHLYEGLDRDAADALVAPWDVSHVAATWSRADYADSSSGL